MATWQTARFTLALDAPKVMGIVNVTPDSFSDGGRHATADAARAHCDQLLREGAHILDIGGESTRPGARAPDLEEELARVIPVLRHAVTLGVPVSVDTSRPEVMRAALEAGADIVNDVRALQRSGAVAVLAEHASAGVCLMHLRGEPGTMQQHTDYTDVVAEVTDFLRRRCAVLHEAGIAHQRITIDPGIGFGKTPEQNWLLLRHTADLVATGWPVLAGWSRKSTLGVLTGRPVQDRLAASIMASVAAVHRGARIVRVHDVAATLDALAVWRAAGLSDSPG